MCLPVGLSALSLASCVLVDHHVYALLCPCVPTDIDCLALCGVTFAQSESRMSYLSTTLLILLKLPGSLHLPPLLEWKHGPHSLQTTLMFSRLQVYESLMHIHQGRLIELLVYPTLLGYIDKSAKWNPLNIAAKEP